MVISTQIYLLAAFELKNSAMLDKKF